MRQHQIIRNIYPSVVTYEADWKRMVAEVRRLKLEEISLFLTIPGYNERQAIYRQLEQTAVRNIPHVHARHDMKEEEYMYLQKRFQTRVFVLHYPYLRNFFSLSIRKKIFVENNQGKDMIASLLPLKKIGGLCVDLSHYAEYKKYQLSLARKIDMLVGSFSVGCNHISGVKTNGFASHHVTSEREFDYLSTLPRSFFSEYLCLEVSNSVATQLLFRKYIAKLLSKTWTNKS